MNQATVLHTLADNLHQFAAVARTLKNNPGDIRKGLVEKRALLIQGQISFCLRIWAITTVQAGQMGGQVSTLSDALETLRKVNSANYSLQLGGKQQAINDAHDEVDSAIRGLNKTVQELRSSALKLTTNAA